MKKTHSGGRCDLLKIAAALGLSIAGAQAFRRVWENWNEHYPDLIGSGISVGRIFKSGDLYYFTVLAGLFYALLAVIFWRWPPSDPFSGGPKNETLNRQINRWIAGGLAYFAGAGVFTAVCALGFGPLSPKLSLFLELGWMLAAGAMAARIPPERLRSWAEPILPLLLFRLLGVEYLHPSGSERILLNPVAAVVLIGVILFLVALAVRRSGRGQSISPSTVISLSMFLGFRIPKAAGLGLDDYHAGEMIIPFDQFYGWGQRMYSDFVSVHGWLAVSYGGVHHFLTDGTYAAVPFAFALTLALAAGLFAAFSTWGLGGGLALGVSVLAIPSLDRFTLVPFFFLAVLLFPAASRWFWFLLTFVFSPFALLFNPASGSAMILASVPWQWSQIRRFNSSRDPGSRRRWIVAILAGGACLGWFYHPLRGVVEFILENGRGTVQAFGISMHEPHSLPSWLQGKVSEAESGFLASGFKALKFYGWFAGSGWVAWLAWSGRKQMEASWLSVLAIPVFLIPYSYGRIGTDGLDRAGNVSILMLGMAVPLAAAIRAKRERLHVGAVLLVFLLSGLGWRILANAKDLRTPFSMAQGVVAVPPDFIPLRGEELGIPRLGHTFGDPRRHDELAAWSELLRQNPGIQREGWLDLTNRQSHFFILGGPVRQVYPSHLLAINESLQDRMIQGLEAHPVHLAWIAPMTDYEAVRFPLRAYRLYRWVMENSDLRRRVNIGPNEWLASAPGASWDPTVVAELDRQWHTENLRGLPDAWGGSWATLEDRFERIDAWDARSGGEPRASRAYDFVLIEGRSNSEGKCRLSAPGYDRSFVFSTHASADDSRFLVPAGSAPSWLLHPPITVRVECPGTVVSRVQFLKLVH